MSIGVIVSFAIWRIYSMQSITPSSFDYLPLSCTQQELRAALEAAKSYENKAQGNPPQGRPDPGAILPDDAERGKQYYSPSFEQAAGLDFTAPDTRECTLLDDASEFLPDYVHIPFEDAVAGDSLVGWEDDWVAHGTYNVEKWGKMSEPKVDFIYLCKMFEHPTGNYSLILSRGQWVR